MSENPVRKASEKAAKEMWVLKNTSSVPSEIQSQMADIIESKFAPVVAAAEEAMKEKCEELANIEATAWGSEEKKRVAENIAESIRAIPTGTALAEHVDRATAELRAENKELADDYQSLGQERERELNSLKAQLAARESIFKWLLGEEGDFPMRTETFGAYWWRPALRQRIAALSAPAKEGEK